MLSYSKGQAVVVFLKWLLCYLGCGVAALLFVNVVSMVFTLVNGGSVSKDFFEKHVLTNPWGLVLGGILWLIWFLRWETKSRGVSWRAVFSLRVGRAIWLLPAVLIAIGGVIIAVELDNLMSYLFPKLTSDTHMEQMVQLHPLGAALVLIIIAPVTEETVFRGVLLRGLLNRRVSAWAAIALTAFLFGIVHGSLHKLPLTFIDALFFGWVYLRTRSLVCCMAIHAVHNTVAFVAYLSPAVNHALGRDSEFNMWWLDMAAVVLLAGGIMWLRFLTRRGLPPDELAVAKPPPLPPPLPVTA